MVAYTTHLLLSRNPFGARGHMLKLEEALWSLNKMVAYATHSLPSRNPFDVREPNGQCATLGPALAPHCKPRRGLLGGRDRMLKPVPMPVPVPEPVQVPVQMQVPMQVQLQVQMQVSMHMPVRVPVPVPVQMPVRVQVQMQMPMQEPLRAQGLRLKALNACDIECTWLQTHSGFRA